MDEEMKGAPPLPPRIKNNVQGNMGFFQFLGKTVELYLPKAIDAVIASLGGAAEADPPSGNTRPGKDNAPADSKDSGK